MVEFLVDFDTDAVVNMSVAVAESTGRNYHFFEITEGFEYQ